MDRSTSIDVQKFQELCRQHQLKITPQRMAIYQRLMEAQTHPTAEEIFEAILPEYPNLSFDTVYRTLNTFAEIGITTTVEGFGKSRRFDPNLEPHHHFHCESCGKILDFTHADYDNLTLPDKLEKRIQIHSKRVVLTGLCEKCS